MGEAMTTNQTIDGVLISRELLERILSYAWFPSGDVTVFDLRLTDREKLRALLDAPLCKAPSGASCPGDGVGSCKKCPAAQPQGEPYAYEYEFATVLYIGGPGKFKKIITREAPDQHEIDAGCVINVKPLYAPE